ncbi:MAG: FtsX-like permease family protein [Bacteroidales bacterium]|jgi:lipoprotein-releasing system permease protein|nr:FtsX-like permease family protein [Bacteroidales bacterium]
MNLPIFIAWRYAFSKKKLGVIHIISLISLIGIAISTMALVIVLSVFNGFTSVATDMLQRSNPPILIQSTSGKTISDLRSTISNIKLNKEIKVVPVIEEGALLSFGEHQLIVRVRTSDTLKDVNNIILSEGVAYQMNVRDNMVQHGIILKLTLPKRNNLSVGIVPDDNFNYTNLIFGGVCSTKSRLDENYVFVSTQIMQTLLDYDSSTFTAIYVYPSDLNDIEHIQNKLSAVLKDKNVKIQNILQQEPIYYKVVKAEKLGVYIILTFIIFIATFNIVGSISLLLLDKKRDMKILRSMGMTLLKMRLVYFYNGLVLSIIGALVGLFLGITVSILQSNFGLIKMGGNGFLIDAFPIKVIASDIISVFMLVLLIGSLCIGIMVKRIRW